MPQLENVSFSAFEQKWLNAYRESRICLAFLHKHQHLLASAFYSLIFELEQIVFFSRSNTEVAVSKLGWWAEELMRCAAGKPQHPLTQSLITFREISVVAPSMWHELVSGALLLLQEENSVSDLNEQSSRLHKFYLPASKIAAILELESQKSVTINARLWAISTLLRQVSELRQPNEYRFSVIPLQWIARYQISPDELRYTSPQSRALLGNFLKTLKDEIETLLNSIDSFSLLRKVRSRLDLYIIFQVQRSNDPLKTLEHWRYRVPWRTVWYAWQAARYRKE